MEDNTVRQFKKKTDKVKSVVNKEYKKDSFF